MLELSEFFESYHYMIIDVVQQEVVKSHATFDTRLSHSVTFQVSTEHVQVRES
jgi:hypothetical protein